MKRRTTVIIAAAALVVVGGALIAWALLSRADGPRATVDAYFAALERGDGTEASALTDAPAGTPPIEYAALDTATEWIAGPRTTSITDQGVDATATTTFSLAGEQHSATIALSKQSGTWLVTSPPATSLTATSTMGGGIAVGSVAVPFGTPAEIPTTGSPTAGSATLVLPLGVYQVGAAPAAFLAGTAEVVVAGAEPLELSLAPTLLGDAARDAAAAQLTDYLAACTAASTEVPAHCGIRVPWAADLASLTQLTFRVDAVPELAFAPDGTSFAATGGVLIATAVGQDDGGAEASFTYRDSEWAVRGSVGFAVDALTLDVW